MRNVRFATVLAVAGLLFIPATSASAVDKPVITSVTKDANGYIHVSWTLPAGYCSTIFAMGDSPPSTPGGVIGSFGTMYLKCADTTNVSDYAPGPGANGRTIYVQILARAGDGSDVHSEPATIYLAISAPVTPTPIPVSVPGTSTPNPVSLESVSNGCGGGEVDNKPRFLDTVTFESGTKGLRFKVRFRQACNVHDAGYAGAVVRDPLHNNRILDLRNWSRLKVDSAFRANLIQLCDEQLPTSASTARKNCAAYAQAYYAGVRAFGWRFFDADLTKPGMQYLGPRSPLCTVPGPLC